MQHLLSVKIVPLVLMFMTVFIHTVPSRTPQCQLQNGCRCLLCSQGSMPSGHASCCSCGDRGPRIPPTLGGWSTLPWHTACFPTRPRPLWSPYSSPGRKGAPLPLPVSHARPLPHTIFLPKAPFTLHGSNRGGTAADNVIYRGTG